MISHAYDSLDRNLRSSHEEFQDVDAWKQDHNGAMKCFDFEDFLQLYNRTFESICELDEDHRERVLTGKLDYDPNWNRKVDDLYRLWIVPQDPINMIIKHFEEKYSEVRHANDFRSNCREVIGILTPDASAFDSDDLATLRDEAIDEHKRGETLEFGPWE